MFPFLRLSRELRDNVYEHCLVVGKVFPYPEPSLDKRYVDWRSYEKPNIALLEVCKQIRNEGKKVLFSKRNTFIIPRGWNHWWTPPMEDDDRPMARRDDGILRLAPKSVNVAFSFRDAEGDFSRWVTMESFETATDMSSNTLSGTSKAFALERVHDGLREVLFQAWQPKMDWLCHLKDMKHLEIDVSEFTCALGCCFGKELFSDFEEQFELGLPQDVLVTGCHDEAVGVRLNLAIKAFYASCLLYVSATLNPSSDDESHRGLHIFLDGRPEWVSSPLTSAERLVFCHELITYWHEHPSTRERLVNFAVRRGKELDAVEGQD